MTVCVREEGKGDRSWGRVGRGREEGGGLKFPEGFRIAGLFPEKLTQRSKRSRVPLERKSSSNLAFAI